MGVGHRGPGSLGGFNLEWVSWRVRLPAAAGPQIDRSAALIGTEFTAIHHCHATLRTAGHTGEKLDQNL